ncbi:pleiotropic drug resistance protein 3-like [Gossypium australe]|uniref:Pleiotropic drug resistance protein 3-like n=1 Tax=Gossypium australe TaxID=47621 RepID=A0A5B6X5D3_9ROSI|nr:pleiotropic drug resistance protein 3-like [Gossypium australe]
MYLASFTQPPPPIFIVKNVPKKHNEMSCLQNDVSDVIFTRIMTCDIPKQAWDKLKEEFQGLHKTRQQQMINVR